MTMIMARMRERPATPQGIKTMTTRTMTTTRCCMALMLLLISSSTLAAPSTSRVRGYRSSTNLREQELQRLLLERRHLKQNRETRAPTEAPETQAPTQAPSSPPTSQPTAMPTTPPTFMPTPLLATAAPSGSSSMAPTQVPTVGRTSAPTALPTAAKEDAVPATDIPTATPTSAPTSSPPRVFELSPFSIAVDGTVDDWDALRANLELYLADNLDAVSVDLAADNGRRQLQTTEARQFRGIVNMPATFEGDRGQVVTAQEEALQDGEKVATALVGANPSVSAVSVTVDSARSIVPEANGGGGGSDSKNGTGLIVGLVVAACFALLVAGMLTYRRFSSRELPPPPPPPYEVEVIPDFDADDAEVVLRDASKTPDSATTDKTSDDILDDLETAPKSVYSAPVTPESHQLATIREASQSTHASIDVAALTNTAIVATAAKKQKLQRNKESWAANPTMIDGSTGDLEVSVADASTLSEPDAVIYLTKPSTPPRGKEVQTFKAEVDSSPDHQRLFPIPVVKKRSDVQPSAVFMPKTLADDMSDDDTDAGSKTSRQSNNAPAAAAAAATTVKQPPVEFDDNKSWTVASMFSNDEESMAGFSLATMESKEKNTVIVDADMLKTANRTQPAATAGPMSWFQRGFNGSVTAPTKPQQQPQKPPNVAVLDTTPKKATRAEEPKEEGHEVYFDNASESASIISEAPSSHKETSSIYSGMSDVYTTVGDSSALGAFRQDDSEEEDEAFIPMTNKYPLTTIDDDLPSDEMNDKQTQRNDQDLTGFSRADEIRRAMEDDDRRLMGRQRRRVQPPMTMEV